MRISHSLLATALLAAIVATGAWAGDDDMFTRMDSNHDGRISAQEHDAGAAAKFARNDANHDGMLDADEMRSRMGRQAGGMHAGGMQGNDWMAKMDGNHDGVITADEHAAMAKAMFDRMDANHDGRLAGAELEGGHGMRGQRMGDHAMPEGMAHGDRGMGDHAMAGHGMHGQGGMAGAGMRKQAMMDTDNDGKVSASEHAAGARAMFARVDADHDGYISKAEFDARLKAMPPPK
jgi:Ca2+-binding EF-hand superfamily protein